jgi:hypothetical protein
MNIEQLKKDYLEALKRPFTNGKWIKSDMSFYESYNRKTKGGIYLKFPTSRFERDSYYFRRSLEIFLEHYPQHYKIRHPERKEIWELRKVFVENYSKWEWWEHNPYMR